MLPGSDCSHAPLYTCTGKPLRAPANRAATSRFWLQEELMLCLAAAFLSGNSHTAEAKVQGRWFALLTAEVYSQLPSFLKTPWSASKATSVSSDPKPLAWAWQSPKLPHGTDELPCWTVCGPWAVDWGDWWLFCLDYYYYYYFKGPSGGQNGFTERLNSSHAFELCDRQCLKIETVAPPCSPFPSNSSRRMKSCPQPAAPWAGCLSPAASAGAGTASLKGCQGLAGHLPKGRKERRGREKNWKITTKKTSSFLKLETLKKRFMNLWVYETTWCFGVCCWLNLAVQSLVVVSLH